ncbi:hypothetical protein GCM10027596_23660 [Nocardioides korecus]
MAHRSHRLHHRPSPSARTGACAAALLALTACGASTPDAAGTPSSAPTPSATPSPSTPPSATASASPTLAASAAPSSTDPGDPGARTLATTPAPAARVTRTHPGWALDRIDQRRRPLDGAFTTRSQGRGVTVYVVDGLFDPTHAELGGRASVGLRSGRHCVLESGIDHGLFVAGIVGGRRTGVAPQARLVSVGALAGCEGGSVDSSEAQRVARIVRALDWVATHARRPAVANLSLNVPAPAPTVRAAVARVVRAGVTVVAAAGNAGEDACRFPPAGLPSVVTVGGSTRTDRDAGLNHGRCVDLYAPAEQVRSVISPALVPGGVVTADETATSWAAPYASGVAALFLSTHPHAAPARVRRWLLAHATTGALRGDRHGSPDRLLFTGGL